MSLEHRGPRHALPAALDQAQRDARRAVVRTSDGVEIRGVIHIPPGTRTLDFINRPADAFIAVTDATITVGEHLEQAPFVAVNKAHVTVLRELVDGE